MALRPAPSARTPLANMRSTTRSRSSLARTLVPRSLTSSTPIIRPLPRTSPIRRCLPISSRKRPSRCSPTVAAFATRPPSSSLIVADAAAQATGLPPKVLACAPGVQSMTLGAGRGDAERQPGGDALGNRDDVRLQPEVLRGEHLAGAPHARLHFVDDQQDAVLPGQLAQALVELDRRDDVAAFALDRLDDDRRHFVRRDEVHEQPLLDPGDRLGGDLRRRDAGGGAIDVRIRRVEHARRGHRPEALALHGAARRQAERAEGAAVERAEERDQERALGVVARQLDGRFVRLGARVAEEALDLAVDRDDAADLLGQPHLRLVVEVGPRHVQELLRLLDDGGDDVGMRVSGRVDGDAGGAVEELVAVDVLDDGAFTAGHHQRIAAGVGRRHRLGVAGDDRLGVRAGQGRHKLG